jgi:hypothetical protein
MGVERHTVRVAELAQIVRAGRDECMIGRIDFPGDGVRAPVRRLGFVEPSGALQHDTQIVQDVDQSGVLRPPLAFLPVGGVAQAMRRRRVVSRRGGLLRGFRK